MTRGASRNAGSLRCNHSNHPRSLYQRGISLIWLAIMLPVMLGFVALVVEVGMVLEVRRQLQTTVDAGALAGVQELPNSPGDAIAMANDYVNRNGGAVATTVTIGSIYVPNDTVTVSAYRTVPLVLMPLVGYANSQNVPATATAIVGTLGEADCPLPVGVVDLNGAGPDDGFGYDFGESYELKLDALDAGQGNFQGLAIYGQGASDFREGMAGSRCVSVSVNQMVDSKTGNMVGPTIKGLDERIGTDSHAFSDVVQQQADGTALLLDPDCPRIVVIPVVDSFDINGKKPVKIVGFTHFLVESYAQKGNQQGSVWGRFIDVITQGDFAPFDPMGARVVRLIR